LGLVSAFCQGFGLVLAKWGMSGGLHPWAASWLRMTAGTAAIWLMAAVAGRLRDLDLRGSLKLAGRRSSAGR
ncbi:MAG TPA: hypothetical protein PLS53_18690, partial [Thermoanaerobaculaceae bacterium]|nr:hypothetical protein [Thermoanaerobaculaceae bacterium]